MDKEKIFFIICSFVLTMGLTTYSISSDKPDTKPNISTYINSSLTEFTFVSCNTEKSVAMVIIEYPIDLNFATKEELCSLKGIGDVLSDRIIGYRKNNYFYSVEDIMKINGIGEKFLEENKNKITVDTDRIPKKSRTENTYADIASAPKATYTEITTPKETVYVSETVTITPETITYEQTTAIPEKIYNPVNLNTATYEELLELPISPEIAEEIIDLRDKIGYFSSVRELRYIESFSRDLYIELIKYVYVE